MRHINIESSSIERLLSSHEFRFETGYVDTKDLPWMIRKEVLRTTRNNEETNKFHKCKIKKRNEYKHSS